MALNRTSGGHVERRNQDQERRKGAGLSQPAERRTKSRRRARKLVGSPPPERNRIEIDQERDVHYWTKALGISADELRSAVQKVGPNAAAVREHLGK